MTTQPGEPFRKNLAHLKNVADRRKQRSDRWCVRGARRERRSHQRFPFWVEDLKSVNVACSLREQIPSRGARGLHRHAQANHSKAARDEALCVLCGDKSGSSHRARVARSQAKRRGVAAPLVVCRARKTHPCFARCKLTIAREFQHAFRRAARKTRKKLVS